MDRWKIIAVFLVISVGFVLIVSAGLFVSAKEGRYTPVVGDVRETSIDLKVVKSNIIFSDGKNVSDNNQATTVTVDVGGEPQDSLVQSGLGSSLLTKYLPVNITQTIKLIEPTKNITIYPVFADWDGIVRDNLGSSLVDENNSHIAYSGFGTLSLYGVKAICSEPYSIKITSDILANDGIQFENSTEPVLSNIPWGDTFTLNFNEAQTGIINYTVGYGIVPADYNNNNDNTYRNTGAGNQRLLGMYHLSFTSFYSATVKLPEEAELISSLKLVCAINENSPHIQKSEFPYIYIYDLWFKME